MSDPDLQDKLGQPVQVLQIIIVAMVLGVVVFLGVALTVRAGGQGFGQADGTGSLITTVGIAYAVGALLFRSVVRTIVTKAGRRKILQGVSPTDALGGAANPDQNESSGAPGDIDGLLKVFRTKTIIAAAMLEGAVLFLVVAYLIEGRSLALIGAFLLAVFLAFHFPTRSTVADWIDNQRHQLEQDRILQR